MSRRRNKSRLTFRTLLQGTIWVSAMAAILVTSQLVESLPGRTAGKTAPVAAIPEPVPAVADAEDAEEREGTRIAAARALMGAPVVPVPPPPELAEDSLAIAQPSFEEPDPPGGVAAAPALAEALPLTPTQVAFGAIMRPPRPLQPESSGRPMVALVIDDVGHDQRAARALMRLASPLSMAFLPYVPGVTELAAAASDAGKEVLIHLPMEPEGPAFPGPNAIRVGLGREAVEARLEAALATVPNAVGLNNHMGSKATADPALMQLLMAGLADTSLFFLDSRTTGQSAAQAAALENGVPAISRDVFLDNDASESAVLRQLAQTEHLARTRGYAVAIGHPHPGTVKALAAWMPAASTRGVDFVKVSRLVALDTCRHLKPGLAFICMDQPPPLLPPGKAALLGP